MRVEAKILFITFRRIDADRREVWRDGRLVEYRSTTHHDDRLVTVEGHASGDKFIIKGPGGEVVAPGTIRTSNPWSIDLTKASLVMAAETGRLRQTRFIEERPETITIGGRAIEARHFSVATDVTAQLWYDRNNVLVKFDASGPDGEAVGTLSSSSPIGAATPGTAEK